MGLAVAIPDAAAVPVDAQQIDVADRAVLEALHAVLVLLLVPALQADADHEVLGLGHRVRFEHAADAGHIARDRLLHEHVLAPLDRVLELLRLEPRGRRDDDEIDVEVDHLLVTVESSEQALLGNVDLGAVALGQRVDAALRLLRERVGDRDERGGALGVKDLHRCAATATAAPDYGDLDLVLPERTNGGLGDGVRDVERGTCAGRTGLLDERATCRWCWHGGSRWRGGDGIRNRGGDGVQNGNRDDSWSPDQLAAGSRSSIT